MKEKIVSIFFVAALCILPGKAQTEKGEKYRRSSLYSVLVNHSDQKFAAEISKVFLEMPDPDKYNSHDLSVKVLSVDKRMSDNAQITAFLDSNAVASRLVGKWFNRDFLTGQCDVELIKERGLYNASKFDEAMADKSQRGKALLEDAGEDLIGNTFVLMNDVRYVDKEKTGKALSTGLKLFGSFMNAYGGGNTGWEKIGNTLGDMAETLKGFKVKTVSYLYQLVWDEGTATDFYTNFYASTPNEQAKKQAFDAGRSHFKLKYIGSQESSGSDISFLGVNLENPNIMVRKACQRALDENVASLQQNYEAFKVKTPLISAMPITAQIGTKEGITPNSKFEVLEAQLTSEGKTVYKRVGTIQALQNLIWDNRYMAFEEGAVGSELGCTFFKKTSGKDFYPGMLIREIK